MVKRLWKYERINIFSVTSDIIPNSSGQCQNSLSYISQSQKTILPDWLIHQHRDVRAIIWLCLRSLKFTFQSVTTPLHFCPFLRAREHFLEAPHVSPFHVSLASVAVYVQVYISRWTGSSLLTLWAIEYMGTQIYKQNWSSFQKIKRKKESKMTS